MSTTLFSLILLLVFNSVFIAYCDTNIPLPNDIVVQTTDGSPVTEHDMIIVNQKLQEQEKYNLGNLIGDSRQVTILAQDPLFMGYNLTNSPYLFAYGVPFYYLITQGRPVAAAETPILHKFTNDINNVRYEVWACIHGKESLLGLDVCRDKKIPEFDSLAIAAAILHGHWIVGKNHGKGVYSKPILQAINQTGYEFSNTTDMDTPQGVGNVVGKAILEYLSKELWNADGHRTRIVNPVLFEDYTGYQPINDGYSLKYPLRWQPLQEDDGYGYIYFQSHVTPQAGLIEPILATRQDIIEHKVDYPYQGDRNSQQLSAEDETSIRQYSMELFEMQANYTDTIKMLIWLLDDKTRFLSSVYLESSGERNDTKLLLNSVFQLNVLYDMTLLVWKEKLRHDAVRPLSIIKELYRDENIFAWGGNGKGAMEIPGDQFSSYIRTMPHSEFPSASACICEAVMEFQREFNGGNDTLRNTLVVYFPKGSSRIEPGLVPAKDTFIIFRTFSEISIVCAESRLWGGFHFRPSIEAGRDLCKGFGRSAYNKMVTIMGGEL